MGGELLSILVEAKFPAPFYSLICSSSNIVLLFNFCRHVFAFVFLDALASLGSMLESH